MTDEQWKKLKIIYSEARLVKSSERSAFLTQACGGDEQLRLQADSLLENTDKADAEGFLETPALAQAQSSSWTGRRIAHYSVCERIGTGGMGEVYRAEDTKLGRDVALKVLSPSFVQETGRRSRFEREARLLAALNHPHIAAIYGIEDAGDACALVLELVGGPTLADRLKTGPIPVAEALRIAREIAEALEGAHEKAIVHRDLKPANIKIAPNGSVKVLDFGLAKALVGGDSVEHQSLASTQASTGTRHGTILGTPAYMSPEQATGQSESLDTRTDVWAFGCVLFEMLSGRPPFPGNSISDTIAGVLSREPNWDALPDALPESVKRLLRHCLTKDPKQRMQHIANARIELDEVLSTPAASAIRTPAARALRLIGGIAAVLLIAALGSVFFRNASSADRQVSEPTETQITKNTDDDPIASASISFDGKLVVFNDEDAIHIRAIGTNEQRDISRTSRLVPADFCFKCSRFSWSMDGKKILAVGEAGTWPNVRSGIWVITLMPEDVHEILQDSDQGVYSPNQLQLAYWKDDKYWLAGPDGKDGQEILTLDPHCDCTGLKWSPDGLRLVYLKNKTMKGLIESSIESYTLADGTTNVLFKGNGLRDFWWTKDGRLIYSQAAAAEEPTFDLLEVTIDALTSKTTSEPRRLKRWVGYSPGFLSVSGDGKRIVTTKDFSQSEVYVADVEPNGNVKPERRLTKDKGFDWPSGWTPDGSQILFYSDRNGAFNIFRQGESAKFPDHVGQGKDDARAPQISPDGQWLLYMIWPGPNQAGPVRIMRASRSGDDAHLVLKAEHEYADGIAYFSGGEQDPLKKSPRIFPDFRCPATSSAPSCVLAEAEHNRVFFTPFDPITGKRGEPVSMPTAPSKLFWDLSPDGLSVAYGEFRSANNTPITLLTLKDGSTKPVALQKITNLSSLSWADGGRDLYVTTHQLEGGDLWRVALDGTAVLLRHETGRWLIDPRPSATGGRLAFGVRTTDSNVWLIETK